MLLFFSLQSYAQVTGTVKGDDGIELPGVAILIKGTNVGTTTDALGVYSLDAPTSAVLVYSYLGYVTQEVPVGTQTTIDVTMVTDAAALDEVIVVGYGTVRKSQSTGAISTIKSKDITDLPIENTQQALQGRIAGVDVMQAGSKPGTQPRVVIRGRRSFNASNDPLYVLDGIPLATGTGDINPNDVASMEVLKDASATAIYGARGANGVVLITSKRGTKGKPQVFYDAYYGVSQAHDIIKLMDGQQFADTKREAYRQNDGTIPADEAIFTAVELESIALGRSTDYVSGLLKNGNTQSHQIGFAGGNDQSQFYMSLNYYKQNGIIPNQDYNRNVLRLNLDHNITKNIKIGLSSFMNFSVRNGESFNPLGGAYRENPLGKPYEDDGTTLIFLPTEDGLRSNPFSEIVDGAIVNKRRSNRMFAGLYAEWNILSNLKYRFNFGPDFRIEKYDNFQGTFTNARRLAPPAASTGNSTAFNYTVENILSYDKSFLGSHKLNLTAVQSLQKDNFETSAISVSGVASETQQFYNLGTASIINSVGSNLSQWTILSYMGRINYSINDKYLLTATLRGDGSSRFGANTKWGYFPGIALAWNMAEEDFIKSIDAIDLMKLRVSYGSIGNQAIRPYQTQGLLTQTAYNFGDASAFGYAPNTIGNPELKWETSTTANVGLDVSLFQGRIYGSLEYYMTNTKDLLLSRNLPSSIGFTQVTTNIGKTRNQGFEGTISTVNISKSDFSWSTDFTFFTNKEEIVELYGGTEDDIGNGWFIGEPLSVIFDYEKQGIWQSNESDLAASYGGVPGEIRIVDQNNDGAINADDRVIQGSGVPKFSGGITNRLRYKNFDFSAFVYARIGQKIRSNYHTSNNTLFGRYNNIVVDYWTPTNPTNEFPKPNQNQEFPKWNSSLNIFDGSFVKVRNINLGYNVNQSALDRAGISRLRLYSSIQQPFIFSSFIYKYAGSDPETDIDASLDGNVTPAAWTATFGLNVQF
ncbi:SusC/RagA family TonB-linked outer membrane protein [Portibacter lacus]|uniref:SusC/RagA family TonB-linked outer membrane protein n=1 Tax=Portibacter lacus TaxID=1099794 RepID=A0AA37SN59_9BACT|nr:TonB-dependent receptor [Portibacter lacus]GLR16459.1 SusC/RagA family TonB-linked outer membrane protein [Portibacter lacus]